VHSSREARGAAAWAPPAAPARSGALFLLLAVLCAAGIVTARRASLRDLSAVTFPRIKVIADAGEEPAAQMIPASHAAAGGKRSFACRASGA
jgi:hypothetical protein